MKIRASEKGKPSTIRAGSWKGFTPCCSAPAKRVVPIVKMKRIIFIKILGLF
jgi:hypothetical protein